MKYFFLIVSMFLLSFFINAQKIDTITTFEWDTTTHQFNNNAQQIFTYNNACYSTRYLYNFWDSASASYKKYYRNTNSLLANNATSQSLTQLWDDIGNKWENYEKGIFTYTSNPTLASSVLYQMWQTTNSSWVNNRLYNYTYDANGNIINILIKEWKMGAWVNNYQNTYSYNSNSLMTFFLQEMWDATTSSWTNFNLIDYTYTAFNKLLLDSGQKWNKPTSSWINNYKSLYTYDANNFLIKWNYNAWDINTTKYLESQQYQYINDALGNAIETLTLNYNGSTWDTIYKDINHYNSCILPLQLISFNASSNKEKVKLDWQTVNEINVSYFSIQRSIDGNDFENIGQVKAINHNGNHYSFNDPLTFYQSASAYYYRIEIVDKDGTKTYSQIKQIRFKDFSNESLSIYPNPATNYINIIGKNISQIRIIDILGRVIHKKTYQTPINSTQLEVTNIAKGTLFFEIQTIDGTLLFRKIIIQ